MIETTISDKELTLKMKGWDKLWSLKGSLSIQLKNICEVRMLTGSDSAPWLRAPGTCLPGVITAGTYYDGTKGRKEFWCTRHKGNAVLVDIEDDEYSRIVFDVEQASEGLIERLRCLITS